MKNTVEEIKTVVDNAFDSAFDFKQVPLRDYNTKEITEDIKVAIKNGIEAYAQQELEQAVEVALRVANQTVKKHYKDSGLTNTGERISECILSLAPQIMEELGNGA